MYNVLPMRPHRCHGCGSDDFRRSSFYLMKQATETDPSDICIDRLVTYLLLLSRVRPRFNISDTWGVRCDLQSVGRGHSISKCVGNCQYDPWTHVLFQTRFNVLNLHNFTYMYPHCRKTIYTQVVASLRVHAGAQCLSGKVATTRSMGKFC